MWLHINKHLLAVIISSAMVVLPPVACAIELPFFKKDKSKGESSQTQNAGKDGSVSPDQPPVAANNSSTNSSRSSNANSTPKATAEQLDAFKRLYEQGKMFEQRNEMGNAEAAYLQSISAIQNTTNVNEKSQAQYRLAVINARAKKYRASELLFRDAAPHIGEDTVFFCDFAFMYYEQGQFMEAELTLKRALEFSSGDRRTLELLAISILSQRDREIEGMRYLKQALGEERALRELARIYRSRGDIQRAKFAEEKAAILNPQNAVNPMNNVTIDRPRNEQSAFSKHYSDTSVDAASTNNGNNVTVPPIVTNIFTETTLASIAPLPTAPQPPVATQPVPPPSNQVAQNAFEGSGTQNATLPVQTSAEETTASPFNAAFPVNSNEKDNGRSPQPPVQPPTARTAVNPLAQPISAPNAFEMSGDSNAQVRNQNTPPITWQSEKPISQPVTDSRLAASSVRSQDRQLQFPSYTPIQDPSLVGKFVPAPSGDTSGTAFQQQPSSVTNNPPQINPMADVVAYNQNLSQQDNKPYSKFSPLPESVASNNPPIASQSDPSVALRHIKTRLDTVQPAPVTFAPLPPEYNEKTDPNVVVQDSKTFGDTTPPNATGFVNNNAAQGGDIADRLREITNLNQAARKQEQQPQPESSIANVPPAEALAVNQSTPRADEVNSAKSIPTVREPSRERDVSSVPVNPVSSAPVTTAPYTYQERGYASAAQPTTNQNSPSLVIPESLSSNQAAPNNMARTTNAAPKPAAVGDLPLRTTLPPLANERKPIAPPVNNLDPRTIAANPMPPNPPLPPDQPKASASLVASPVPAKPLQEIASNQIASNRNENRSQPLTQAQRQQQLQKKIAARQTETSSGTNGIPQESMSAKQVITTRDLDEQQYVQRQRQLYQAPPKTVTLAPVLSGDNYSNQSTELNWDGEDVGFTSTKQVTKQKNIQQDSPLMNINDNYIGTRQYR